jgi:predicted nucleic-acid-binding Zn-ribbon protein
MPNANPCAKCGSSQMISGVRVVCNVEGGDQNIKLRVDAHPDAMVFKQAQRAVLAAAVCGKCGYTEFYVEEPGALYEAYREAQGR